MGLRYVKGLGERERAALEQTAPFQSIDDVARRARLDEKALVALAEAGAFESLAEARGDRRAAVWQARAPRVSPLAVDAEPPVAFAPLTDFEAIAWDHRRSAHSTRGHPLAPLRDQLRAQGLPDAREVAAMKHGARVRYAGLVICRQHPGTASGVTFMTLEDETGIVNLVVWRAVFQQFFALAVTQPFLGVSGKLQKEGEVVHVVVDELWRPEWHAPTALASRNFR
jgi:error-prone DNA polymerase